MHIYTYIFFCINSMGEQIIASLDEHDLTTYVVKTGYLDQGNLKA